MPTPTEASSLCRSDSSSSLSLIYLADWMLKSVEWLNELRELHYVPYNSCNSLTVYSYKYWQSERKILVATKANNLKEFYFRSVLDNEDNSLDTGEFVFSNRSSVSSSTSNAAANNTAASAAHEALQPHKSSVVNSISTEEKSMSSPNALVTYLEPIVKIHHFKKIKSIIYLVSFCNVAI